MALTPGSKFGLYEVLGTLGAGGMGEVYRARDPRLGRDVAIKILPEAVAADPDRLARFEREAQVLASLNHPNIGSIYGLEESGGSQGLVLELIEGSDLSQRLEQGPLPVDEVVRIARQIAEGLEAAHERGIVHRDLKPANVQCTSDGPVKILDFGLAKATEAASSGTNLSMSPTLTVAATQAGVILGTASYMSPEQNRGQDTDRRADVWAFGCVVYELLTGMRAFQGATVSDILAGVLRAEPDLGLLPEDTPPRLKVLLGRCLRKDPRRRLRDLGDARVELEEIAEHPEASAGPDPAPAPAPVGVLRWIPWGVTGLLALTLLATVWWLAGTGSVLPQKRLLITLDAGVVIPQSNEPVLAISRDGNRVAILAERAEGDSGIFIREMDQLQARRLAGAEEGSGPFFSPDGEWVGFFQNGKLKKVPVAGGPALTVAEVQPIHRGAHWGADGKIVFSPAASSGILEVPAEGGETRIVSTLDTEAHERTHRFPQIVPGERWVIFTVGSINSPEYYDDARIDAVFRETGERHAVLEGASMARALPTGHLVYAREGLLFAVPFDLETAQVTGPAVLIQEGVGAFQQSGAAHFDVGLDGTLVFLPGSAQNRLSHLVWVDRDGNLEQITEEPASRTQLALSPDGRYAAVIRASEVTNDLWVRDMEQGSSHRLTFEGTVFGASWSPDGQAIAFSSTRDGQMAAIYTIPRDGSREETLLWALEGAPLTADGWSPDGKALLVEVNTEPGNGDLWVVPLQDGEEPYPFLEREDSDGMASFSPDGRWVVFVSRQGGTEEVHVREFPGPGGRWQVSQGGGWEPRWSADGKEIYFRNEDQTLVAAVDTSAGFRSGTPRVLFRHNLLRTIDFMYSPSPTGERFLAIESLSQSARPEVAVVLGWFEELRRRVPNGTGG